MRNAPIVGTPFWEEQDRRRNTPVGLVAELYQMKYGEAVKYEKEARLWKEKAIEAKKQVSALKRK